VRVALPESVIEEGLMVGLRPNPEVIVVRVTALLNPFRELRVTVEGLVAGAVMVREVGLAERVKSGPVTRTETIAKWDRELLPASISTP